MIRVYRAEQGYPTTPNVPTYAPLPIPESGAFDDDTICISINKKWARRVADVLSYLDQPDVWDGSENEVWNARDEAKKIMGALRSEEGNCESTVDAIIDMRLNANEQIEYTKDGVIWTPLNPRLVPNNHPSFEAEVSVSGEARFPNMSLNAASLADTTRQDFYSRGIGGTPRLTGRISAQHETPGAPTPTRLSLEAFSSGWHKSLEIGANSGVPEIGFFGKAPTNRRTIVGEIPFGPTYELAQAMLQYGLIGGAIIGVDPEPPGDSEELLMDVTMGDDCHLEIWRFDNETPVIWRSIDLRACLARYAPGWMFESVFLSGPAANDQWDVTNGTMTTSGLEPQDTNVGGGTGYISSSNAVWIFEERYALTSIEVLYEVAPGASWSGMAIHIYVDFAAEEVIEIDPTPGDTGVLIWNAPDGIMDVLSVRVGTDYQWDSIANTNPDIHILSVRIAGKGDELTEES